MLWLFFTSELDWCSYIVSLFQTVSKKWSLFAKVTVSIYKSNIRLCMRFCCHIQLAAANFYLGLFDKLLKWVTSKYACYFQECIEVCQSLSICLTFCRSSSELMELVPLSLTCWSSIRCNDGLCDFFDTITIHTIQLQLLLLCV